MAKIQILIRGLRQESRVAQYFGIGAFLLIIFGMVLTRSQGRATNPGVPPEVPFLMLLGFLALAHSRLTLRIAQVAEAFSHFQAPGTSEGLQSVPDRAENRPPTPVAKTEAGQRSITITPDLQALLRSLVERWLSSPDRQDRAIAKAARISGALQVYSDMGGTLFLRPDGAILALDHNSENDGPRIETNEAWKITAVVAGAEKYPELRPLLPIRPQGTEDCEVCAGHGRIRIVEADHRVWCGMCHGLGWLVTPT